MHDIATGRSGAFGEPARSRPALDAPSDGLLVAVPLYQAPELVPVLVDALVGVADELADLRATVLLIVDSPGHAALDAMLAAELPRLRAAGVAMELHRNPTNLGFVRSANHALAIGRDTDRDVILLNSDALPRPGAFAEMVAVAYADPMVAAVSPRSDNATICNSPFADDCRPGDREGAWAAHRAIARYLPRLTFAPTAIGFCMLIRRLMLREFGLFDEAYGAGYNEENDFVRRCNQRGYRAVLANHAYVHHVGGASFATEGVVEHPRERANRALLDERYPEYEGLIRRYLDGPELQAQRLLGGLVPLPDGRLRLLFDVRILKPFFNGTHEHLCAVLRAFAACQSHRFDTGVLCNGDAFRFHGLDRVAGLRLVDEEEARVWPSAAAVRLGQPFSVEDLAPLVGWAPVNGALMLDTIAMDCQQLDEADLELVWQLLLDDVDLIGFNSAFSHDQFARRFAVPPTVRQFVSRCSTEVTDYAPPASSGEGHGILVVGNHYPHKHVEETVAALRARDRRVAVTVLGLSLDPALGARCLTAGDLPQAEVDALYGEAALVLLPSHYEGFGLPILHGLARGRPVVARDLPCAREIKALCPQAVNLHLADSTDALVSQALAMPRWRPVPPDARSPEDWGRAADAIAEAVEGAIADFRFETCRRRQARAAAWRAAGAGAPGQPARFALAAGRRARGFMLDPAAWGPRAGDAAIPTEVPHAVLGDASRSDAAPVAALALAAGAEDMDRVQALLLDWLRRLEPGGRLWLTLPAGSPALAGGEAAQTEAGALVAMLGCRVDAVRANDSTLTVAATKLANWTAVLPGPDSDGSFVRLLYRHALGREPDRDGARHYAGELAAGHSREELLGRFLRSSERRDRVVPLVRAALAGG